MDAMPKGILYVETRPISPEREAEFHQWYDEVHLAEVLTIPGFVAAERFVPVREDGGPFVAIYHIEADDLRVPMRALIQVIREDRFNMSEAIQLDPAPSMRLLELTTSLGPEPANRTVEA
jgi:hypothetical protein